MVAEPAATAADVPAGAAGVDADLLPDAGFPQTLQPPGLPQQVRSEETSGKGKGSGGGGWKRRMVGEGRQQETSGEASGSGGGGGMTMEMRREMDRMWQAWTQQQQQNQQGQVHAEPPRAPKDDWKRVILDEKYFRRVDKFEGDVTRFRGWMFDVMVAIGQVDNELAKELKGVLSRGLDEKWNPEEDQSIDKRTYEKYTAELYGIVCALTAGEAKNVVRASWTQAWHKTVTRRWWSSTRGLTRRPQQACCSLS
jgi:hypothetical protein